MRNPGKRPTRGWTLVETLITVAIVAVLAAIAIPVNKSIKARAHRNHAIGKLKTLGTALVSYTTDHNGRLPMEDAPGSDSWQAAADPENAEAWYNTLPELVGADALGKLANTPRRMYEDSYPLYLAGAPYPSSDKKLGQPYFAIAMNSRLQRKDEEGLKKAGTLTSIQDPHRTVAFLERGMPGDKKTNPGQRGFDAGPKANARAFAARYNGKGLLIFIDGHVEMYSVSDLINPAGTIKFPQTDVVWTPDPDEDPN
ncbi:MAG: prepilin-type N-terminal cleavage/methylation domain-containing protein [Verrucomicrobiae bacterium]|nr:prepilin-type N-terminal cleavage/methylation domain-containing protein [Verrucomicrobiae bacterium]MCP5532469.1 prepilin-type N-terminal cleavage/methylation domain-containing protein [Akkermansiaceae bacterium]MCP5542710.1 prepilin-type N-terminal cleavage/methylation domain-containing protein [Akkermansiaceae bacterium]MCP5548668.1 prepilin-type N-terminal cleavage/methylation domain-containing protein [Akkermansiaceae bacterium]